MDCPAFGDGQLTVSFATPDGSPLPCGPFPVRRISGEYAADYTTIGQVELEGFCCDLCPELRPLWHEMRIERTGEGVVWAGPIPPEGIIQTEDATFIEAFDRSFWWLRQRVTDTREAWAGRAETHAARLVGYMCTDYGATTPVVTTISGHRYVLDYRAGEEVFRPMEQLHQDVVDWSTIVGTTYIGAPHIDPGLPPLMLSAGELEGGAGVGWAGTGFTSASGLSTVDDVSVESVEYSTVDVPWKLHTSVVEQDGQDPGLAGLVADTLPRRGLTVDLNALTCRTDACLRDLVPGRRVLLTDPCSGEPSEQIIAVVSFQWERGFDGAESRETISIGTRTPITF